MEIGQLEAFLQVAEHNSFSKAAKSLFLTQPSLSARMQSMERELGELLFVRLSRGVILTDAGRAFLPHAERALHALKEGREALEEVHAASSGKLYLGSARAISAYVLPSILKTFRTRHPGVDVAIKTGRSHRVLEMVLSDEVQVGLARTLVHPEIESVHLYNEEIVLVAHPDHPFAISGATSVRDIAKERLILYDKESTYYVMINSICREAGISPNVVMDLDSIDATKHMIQEGLGISFLPQSAIEKELELGTLTHVKISDDLKVELPTSVLYRKGRMHGGIVTAFLQTLQDLYDVTFPPQQRSSQRDNQG